MRPMTGEPVVLGADFLHDPHSIYARLRTQGPVHEVIMPTGLKVWLVTGYEEGRALLADPRLSKNMADAGHLFERHQTDMSRQRDYSHSINRSMFNMDPPDHTRLRALATKAFTTRQVTRLQPRIEEIVDDLLDGLAGRDEFDLIGEFASPMVSVVISDLLGVPEGERAEFRTRSAVLASDASRQAVAEASDALLAQVSTIIAGKRAEPGDDLLSSLLAAADGDDRLTHEEIVSITILLLVGGHDTTVHLIGNGMLALLCNPSQLAALRADPALLPAAVEEFLRFDSPANISHFRCTTAEIRVGDVTVPAGEFVFVGLTSANRDDERFALPDQLDITRTPGGHLSFGHGIHRCFGAPLARLEGEIAFGRLLERFSHLSLAVDHDELRWRPSMLLRGLRELPVRTTR